MSTPASSPIRKFLVIVCLATSLVAGFNETVHAAKKKHKESSSSSKVLKFSPKTLRRRLLDRNISVLKALNKVYVARDEVTKARGEFYPSLNLGALLSPEGIFKLSYIGIAVPFLLPSNWFNLDARKRILAADGYAFYLVELNEYLGAYAMYLDMLTDMELCETARIAHDDAVKIVELLEQQGAQGYPVKESTINQFKVLEKFSQIGYLQAQQGLAREKAAFREMMSLSLHHEIELEPFHPKPLEAEDWKVKKILEKTYSTSPERRQIDSLIEAARDARWSETFGFLGGVEISPEISENNSVSFSKLTTSGHVGLGFGTLPAISIADHNIEALKLRRREIKLEQTRAIESTVSALKFLKEELAAAIEAERIAKLTYEDATAKIARGEPDVFEMIQSVQMKVNSTQMRIHIQSSLDHQRLSLMRILIQGEFAEIPRCRLENQSSHGGPLGWLADFFNPHASVTTVDYLCRSQTGAYGMEIEAVSDFQVEQP